MPAPGFTAEASVYIPSNYYQTVTGPAPSGRQQHVTAQQLSLSAVSSWSWPWRICRGCLICYPSGLCRCYYPCPVVGGPLPQSLSLPFSRLPSVSTLGETD
jgi:hypothetical protein